MLSILMIFVVIVVVCCFSEICMAIVFVVLPVENPWRFKFCIISTHCFLERDNGQESPTSTEIKHNSLCTNLNWPISRSCLANAAGKVNLFCCLVEHIFCEWIGSTLWTFSQWNDLWCEYCIQQLYLSFLRVFNSPH